MSMAELKLEPPDSPYLPNTNIQYAWDSVSLGALKTCPRYYQLSILEGWQPKGEGIHLRFGIEYHQALHDYELAKIDGADHDEALRRTLRKLFERIWTWDPEPRTQAEKKKSKDNLAKSIVWYLDHFIDDACETVIRQDGLPAIEQSFRYELSWGPASATDIPYILCGHLDRIVEYLDGIYVMDRKTSGNALSPSYFAQFDPNNQITGYTLAARVILEMPIKGVIIDSVNVAPGIDRQGQPHKPFERHFVYKTEDQLQEWVDSLQFWLAQAEAYAKNKFWPMNDTSCDKYGGCNFREICTKSPQVRERFLRSNFIKQGKDERWNPLKNR